MSENELGKMVINSASKDLIKLETISKAINVSKEIVNILVKHHCTVLEARELMKGYYQSFDEAIQKDPSKMNEPLRENLFRA